MAGLLDLIEAVPKAALGVLGIGDGPAPSGGSAAAGGAPSGPAGLLSPRSYMHPVRDAILQTLGGAAGRLDQSLQASDMARYQRDRMSAIYSALPDKYKAAFSLDPQGFVTEFMKNYGPLTLKGGETAVLGGPEGTQVTAPLLTSENNRFFTQTPQGTTQTGSAGPKVSARDGLLVDETGQAGNGGVLGTYSQPQKMAPGEAPGTFAPTVSGVGPAPSMGPPAAAPTAPPANAAGSMAPRGIRNNNPGNLQPIKGGWTGQTGVDPQGYAVFGSVQDGIRAADANLAAYGHLHGIDTLSGVVQRWAPAAAGNNPAAYTAAVSKLSGIAPDQKIDLSSPQVRARILSAMFQVENGRPVALEPAQSPASMGAASAPAGWSVGQTSKALWSEPHKVPGVEGLYQTNSATGETRKVADAPFGVADVTGLMKDLTGSQIYQKAAHATDMYRSAINAAQRPGGMSDAELIDFAAQELSGGVARQFNQKTLENAQGPLARLKQYGPQLISGQRLSPEARQALLQTMHDYAIEAQSSFKSLAQSRAALAGGQGFDISPYVSPLMRDLPDVPGVRSIPSGGSAAPAGAKPPPGAQRAPDGNWYLPDPKRPGQYLMWKP